MIPNNFLPPLLQQWQLSLYSQENVPDPGIHFDEETCYLLTLPGALTSASKEQIAHLSTCPLCLHNWTEWNKAKNLAEEEQKSDYTCSYGLLEAAAGTHQKEAITSKSVCGRFTLRIFPQKDSANQAMVALEYTGDASEDMEGKRFVILEGGGTVLLDGRLHNGRLARINTNMHKISLGQWTIVEEKC